MSLKTEELVRILQGQLSETWKRERGIEVQTVAFSNICCNLKQLSAVKSGITK